MPRSSSIKLSDFAAPTTTRPLVIEGAGGLLVPLNNDGTTILDLIKHLKAEAVVVIRAWLEIFYWRGAGSLSFYKYLVRPLISSSVNQQPF